MNDVKEWVIEATISILTYTYAETKEEAEKEAHKYLSDICKGLYPDCCSNDYDIDSVYSYEEDE